MATDYQTELDQIARDERWPLNRYAAFTRSPKHSGYVSLVNHEEVVVIGADGKPVPQGEVQHFTFQAFDFTGATGTGMRYGFPFHGNSPHSAAGSAMTYRAVRAARLLAEPKHWAEHTAPAAQIAGGLLDQGTPETPYLKLALEEIARRIQLATLGLIQMEQLRLVLNPRTAFSLAVSAEVAQYRSAGHAKIERLRGRTNPNAVYQMPASIYGAELVVDDTLVFSTKDGKTHSHWALPDRTAVVVGRVGERDEKYGIPSLSALTVFWHGAHELTLRPGGDGEQSIVQGEIYELLTNPSAGFLITEATAPV